MTTSLYFICTLLSTTSWQAEALQPFFSDLIKLFDTSGITIIIGSDFEEEHDITEIDINHPTSFMSYSGSSAEVSEIVEQLHLQRDTGDLDLILFLGNDHSELLISLVNVEKFFNYGTSGLMAEEAYGDGKLALQLNSKMYFYAWEDDFKFILKERYNITDIPVENNVGSWTEGTGFEVQQKNIWERRSDFYGATVRVASINLDPLNALNDCSGEGEGVEVCYEGGECKEIQICGEGSGFFVEPVKYLAEWLNFTIQFRFSIDGKWGGQDKNGVFNGMIGMLVRDEADVATAALTRTLARNDVAPFGITLFIEKSTLAGPVTDTQAINVWVFFDIFPKITWVVIGLTILVIGVGFVVIKTSTDRAQIVRESEEMNIFNAMGMSALPTEVELAPYNINMNYLSSRILFFFGGIVLFVLFAHYEANLTASMTSGPQESGIKSFDDVIKGEYRVVVEDSTSMHIFMKTAQPGSAMHQFYYDVMENDETSFVGGLQDSIDALFERDKTLVFTSSLYDFMTIGSRLSYMTIQGCETTFWFSRCKTFLINLHHNIHLSRSLSVFN